LIAQTVNRETRGQWYDRFGKTHPELVMTQARDTVVLSLLLLLGGCFVRLQDIQQTSPVRTTTFTGSHKTVAACIHSRLGGKVAGFEFGEVQDRIAIYDSVKSFSNQGLSHYSMTVVKTGPSQGIVEWRTVNNQVAPADRPALADAMVKRFWDPVQECAEQAKKPT
jgi:hypothetical protein